MSYDQVESAAARTVSALGHQGVIPGFGEAALIICSDVLACLRTMSIQTTIIQMLLGFACQVKSSRAMRLLLHGACSKELRELT